jgi:hypothetical protein
MYEFSRDTGVSSPRRSGSFLNELRRQTRVFVDDEPDPEDYPREIESAGRRYGDGEGDGLSGDENARAGADEGDSGDDEDREVRRSDGVGLGVS